MSTIVSVAGRARMHRMFSDRGGGLAVLRHWNDMRLSHPLIISLLIGIAVGAVPSSCFDANQDRLAAPLWSIGSNIVAAQVVKPTLDPKTRELMTIRYRNSRVFDVCRGIAERAGIQIHITENAISSIRVTIELEGVSVEKALDELARLAGVEYVVTDSQTVVLRRALDKKVEPVAQLPN